MSTNDEYLLKILVSAFGATSSMKAKVMALIPTVFSWTFCLKLSP